MFHLLIPIKLPSPLVNTNSLFIRANSAFLPAIMSCFIAVVLQSNEMKHLLSGDELKNNQDICCVCADV